MRYLIVIALVLSAKTFAASNFCGDIQRMRTWAEGTDTYGVWVEYKNNPEQCPGGFYLKQDANNRELIYSTLLASKMANQSICIQVFSFDQNNGNRCQLHYVYHP